MGILLRWLRSIQIYYLGMEEFVILACTSFSQKSGSRSQDIDIIMLYKVTKVNELWKS